MLHVDTVSDVFALLMLWQCCSGVAELGQDALGLVERGKEMRGVF